MKKEFPEELFKYIPVTKGYDRFTIAYHEVIDKENELDFLSLEHGGAMSSLSTHNTYACYIDSEFDNRWVYYVRFPNEEEWQQIW